MAFDWIVCDDRSDDETLEILRAEAGDRIRIVVNSERLGLARNWNECVAQSRTPLVAIFHQDDVMRPGHLRAHLSAFAADPGVGPDRSAADVIDEAGRPIPESVVERGGLGPSDRTFGPGELLADWPSAIRSAARRSRSDGRRTPRWAASTRPIGMSSTGTSGCGSRRVPVAWLARPSVDVRWHSASETHRFKSGTADLDETARLLDVLAVGMPRGRRPGRHDATIIAWRGPT